MTTQDHRPSVVTTAYDPVTFSVILSRFNTIASEMTLTLEHTAWSSILSLGRDYSCAIYDAVPRQVCMVDALPVHTTSMHLVLGEIARTFEGRISEGDVFACNHPYRLNTHAPDLVTAAPVFVDGVHRFWSATKAHQQDMGCFIPSTMAAGAEDVWQEGLHIPPIKFSEKGRMCDELIDLYLANIRYPDVLRGDLLAQLGSIETGRTRLVELAAEYGDTALMQYVDAMIDYADRRMANEIAAMPDGTYFGETWLDSAGTDELHVPIRVSVTIDGDQVLADFSESGAQSPKGFNGSYATSVASAGTPFMYYIDPDIPHNHGCIQHIDTKFREGSICQARYPASTAMATIMPSNAMQDAVNIALASVIPDRVVAGGTRCGTMGDVSGVDASTGQAWGAMVFNSNGGGGAAKNTDGWPMWTSAGGLGGLKSLSVEQLELLYPLVVDEMEIETDSMGLGETIGGPGIRFRMRPTRGPVRCATFADGYLNPPYGVLGGTAGMGGGQYVENLDTGRRRFMSGSGYFEIGEREAWVSVATGGGGYGTPMNRPVERVRTDVRDGFISRRAAEKVFGVVLNDADDPRVDVPATTALRARLEGIDRSAVEPRSPGAGTWTEDNMREGDEYFLNPTL